MVGACALTPASRAPASGPDCRTEFTSLLEKTQDEGRIPEHLDALERELRKIVEHDTELKQSDILRHKLLEILSSSKSELELRGFEVRIADHLEGHGHSLPVLEILNPPELESDLISRNLRTISKAKTETLVVYDPLSLVTRKVRGSWNASRQLLSVNLASLFDRRTIPSTLVHERMHFEKSRAINARSHGPLKAFFGYFNAQSLAGKSGYARRGFISVDEAKAWMTNIRSREQDLRKILRKAGPSQIEVKNIRRDSLIALYKNYLLIADDLISHLEAVQRKIDRRFFRGTQFTQKVWFQDQPVISAGVTTELDGVEFEYWVPLVSVSQHSTPSELQSALVTQVTQSLGALHNHKDLVERRYQKALEWLSDTSAPDFDERFLSFVDTPLAL